jgi:hypothetical protein
MISPVDYVEALVSGVHAHMRENWLMTLLQPFADDSGSDPSGHTFVLGGLVSTPDKWVAFTRDWQAALDAGPIKLDYFKMTEAMSFNGQFPKSRGWDETLINRKVSDLIQIAKEHALFGVWVSVRHVNFNKYIRSIPLPQRNLATDTAYMFLLPQYIFAACIAAKRYNLKCVFDFIFDEQKGLMLSSWRHGQG